MIHIYPNIFLKVVSEDSLFYKGFDIFTESYFEVPKTENFIVLTDSIKSLFNEKNRYLLALNLETKTSERSKLMDLTDRSYFRLKNKYE